MKHDDKSVHDCRGRKWMKSPQEMGEVWPVVVQEDHAWTVTCEKDYA